MKMDLILERVQNKFACIIGELCSEPVVLSKFAIWLDLRLCEYKLKGAISLDCSGETPDPSWLKGHDKPVPKPSIQKTGNGQTRPAGKPTGPRLGPKMGPRSVRRPRPELDDYEDTSSMEPADPDTVAIKEEPGLEPGLYPISLTKSNQNRKRSAAETIAVGLEYESESPAKLGRPDTSSNQSLLSVIGNSGDHNLTADSEKDFKVEMPSGLDDSTTQLLDEEESTAHSVYSSSGVHLPSHSPSSADDSGSAQYLASFHSSDSYNLDHAPGHTPDGRLATPVAVFLRGYNDANENSTKSIEDKKLSYKNAASAISIFTRWLAKSGYVEIRPIEEIPPELLDNYLTHFFATVERRNGNEYQSSGLRRIRESLQYYLRNCGYPESITTSPAFAKSRKSFQTKFYQLKQKEKEILIQQYKKNYPEDVTPIACSTPAKPTPVDQNQDDTKDQSKSTELLPVKIESIKSEPIESKEDPADSDPGRGDDPDLDPDDTDYDLNESDVKQGRGRTEVDIECPVCLKSFTRKDSLKRHLRLHNDDPKPYVCQFCELRFNRRDTKNIHQARCQRRVPVSFEEGRPSFMYIPPKIEENQPGFVESPIHFEESSLP